MLAVLIVLVFLIGCAAHTFLIREVKGEKKTFSLYGSDLKPEYPLIIAATLRDLNDPMLQDNVSFHVFAYKDAHLGGTWTNEHAAGHLCALEPNRICLSDQYVTPRAIFHEMAHLHHRHLDRVSTVFSEEWMAVAGDVYKRDQSLPDNDGILTNYSRGDHGEDIAEWVAECYLHLVYDHNQLILLNQNVKADPKYRLKLALLHRYGFFSDAHYAKLKPLFE